MSLTTQNIDYDLTDMHNRLMPVLHQKNISRIPAKLKIWANNLLDELKKELGFLLPLKSEEIHFISDIQKSGKIKPALITDDDLLANTILLHPAIQWAAKKFRAI